MITPVLKPACGHAVTVMAAFVDSLSLTPGGADVMVRARRPCMKTSLGWSALDAAGLSALLVQFVVTVATAADIPSLDLRLPVVQATVAGLLSSVILIGLRLRGERGSRAERLV